MDGTDRAMLWAFLSDLSIVVTGIVVVAAFVACILGAHIVGMCPCA